MQEEHHGIPVDMVDEVIAYLGITYHTDEDCRLSTILSSALGKGVIVDGRTAWVERDGTWDRRRIEAGTRRKLLAGYDLSSFDIDLQPWDEAV